MFVLYFTDFGGFDNVTNTTVRVRASEPVALLCTVLPSVPTPNIVWYKNDQLITISTMSPIKYLLLDQYLVIYDLTDNDIASTYSCAVTNAEVTKLMNSTVVYSLVSSKWYDIIT